MNIRQNKRCSSLGSEVNDKEGKKETTDIFNHKESLNQTYSSFAIKPNNRIRIMKPEPSYCQGEERPLELRPQFVDRYVRSVLDKDSDPTLFKQKLEVVKKIMELNIDNRTLN